MKRVAVDARLGEWALRLFLIYGISGWVRDVLGDKSTFLQIAVAIALVTVVYLILYWLVRLGIRYDK